MAVYCEIQKMHCLLFLSTQYLFFQRLCEELEYSELLDLAAETSGAIERMALIAAFAVSAYSATAHRAASKPFNPLLAETYECVRDDKGFRFIAEQVTLYSSHLLYLPTSQRNH